MSECCFNCFPVPDRQSSVGILYCRPTPAILTHLTPKIHRSTPTLNSVFSKPQHARIPIPSFRRRLPFVCGPTVPPHPSCFDWAVAVTLLEHGSTQIALIVDWHRHYSFTNMVPIMIMAQQADGTRLAPAVVKEKKKSSGWSLVGLYPCYIFRF